MNRVHDWRTDIPSVPFACSVDRLLYALPSAKREDIEILFDEGGILKARIKIGEYTFIWHEGPNQLFWFDE